MKPLGLEEIRGAIHGRWLSRGAAMDVSGVTTDSRAAKRGELFLAIQGDKFDGHAFLEVAAKAGCVAAVVRLDADPKPEIASLFPGGVLGVHDTVTALGELASYYRGLMGTPVIGVTGSNGKTTVKRMIHHVLSKRLRGTCSPKSFNNNIGVPLTLLGSGIGDDYVVCEVGTNAPGEIAALAAIARPDVAVITSVGPVHLEKLVSISHVAVEKASLLGATSPKGVAIVWADSEPLEKALKQYPHRRIRFGTNPSADLRLTGYEATAGGQRFQLNDHLWVSLPVAGRHNASNALAAIAVAQRFGFSQEEAAADLADFGGTEMRLQWNRCGAITLINDAYNANPASMLAGADVLADAAGRRKVLIAGDMRELGAQAQQLHFQVGREIAARKIDLLIAVGELGRYIAAGAAQGGIGAETFATVKDAAAHVPSLLREGDVVLLKGSRAMQMEKLLEPICRAFSPGEAAHEKGTT